MNNNFSFARIGALNKLYLTSQRKMLLTIGLVAIGLVAIFYIVPLLFSVAFMREFDLDTVNAAGNSLAILSIIYVIAISISMRPYFKRRGATAAIMLPAKNSEKFLTIFVRTLVVNGVALVAISIVANLLFSDIMGNAIDWTLWFPTTLKGWMNNMMQFCFAHAIFLFGATIFKRNAFLYTVLCLLGLSLVVGIITTYGIVIGRPTGTLSIETSNLIKIGIKSFIGLATVAMWWFSWVRFKNITIAS